MYYILVVVVVYCHYKTCCTLKGKNFCSQVPAITIYNIQQYTDTEERMDKLRVTRIVSDHIMLEQYSGASCQSHTSGVYCFLALDTKQGHHLV